MWTWTIVQGGRGLSGVHKEDEDDVNKEVDEDDVWTRRRMHMCSNVMHRLDIIGQELISELFVSSRKAFQEYGYTITLLQLYSNLKYSYNYMYN